MNDVIKKVLLWVVGGLFSLSVLGALVGKKEAPPATVTAESPAHAQPVAAPQAVQQPAAETQPAAAVPVTEVPIQELLSTYAQNEVRADAAYKGKRIRVSGKVDEVKKDLMGDIYVAVGTGKQFEIPQVQAFFEDELAGQAAQLNKGDTVTVECTCSGLLMNVLMKECVFVQK